MPSERFPITLVARPPYGHDWHKKPGLDEHPQPMDAHCEVCRRLIDRNARAYKLHWSQRLYAHAKCVDAEQHWVTALLVARRMFDPEHDAWDWPSNDERLHYHHVASWAMNSIAVLRAAVPVTYLLGVPPEDDDGEVPRLDADRRGVVTITRL